MAEYLAEPEEGENPRLTVQLTPNGQKLNADKCRHCGGVVVWNPVDHRWEHYQTWEVECSDEAIAAKRRKPGQGGLVIQEHYRRN